MVEKNTSKRHYRRHIERNFPKRRGCWDTGASHKVLVKAASKATYAVEGKRDVNDEKLITVFSGLESFLASRPSTYPRDDVPLTSNFLHEQMGEELLSPLKLLICISIISRVWRRWLMEFVRALT